MGRIIKGMLTDGEYCPVLANDYREFAHLRLPPFPKGWERMGHPLSSVGIDCCQSRIDITRGTTWVLLIIWRRISDRYRPGRTCCRTPKWRFSTPIRARWLALCAVSVRRWFTFRCVRDAATAPDQVWSSR